MTGSQTPTIRPVRSEDYPVWHKLWTGYLSYYETELPEETYTTSFARLLSDDPTTFRGRVAEVAGACVGLVHFVFHPHMWRAAPVCYLQDLYTAPEARGAGVARGLIEAVYAEADAMGAPQVYWLTQEFNYRGRMLYDKVGRKTQFIRYDRPLA